MIPVFKPHLGNDELRALAGIFKSGWIGLGPKTREFEEKFAAYIGTRYAIAVNSCTSALHLSLKVMGVEGGEVVTTPMTFVSTNHAILYNQAVPVFADIEEDTLNIDVTSIREKITRRTKAIVVVHYGGHACDMKPILGLARRQGLKVIEDAAHACGGRYYDGKKWRMLGSVGDIGCFSFHAVKNLAVGDGGMITTNDPAVAARLKKLRWMGISQDTWGRASGKSGYSWHYDVDEVGYKAHMNDIAAAIGLVQLRKLDWMNKKRRQLSERYTRAFKDIDAVEVPVEKPYAQSAWHNYVVKAPRRDELIRFLKSRGISAGVHYIPNHLYKIYAPYRTALPVCERVWKKLATLPLFYDLNLESQRKVIRAVKDYYK